MHISDIFYTTGPALDVMGILHLVPTVMESLDSRTTWDKLKPAVQYYTEELPHPELTEAEVEQWAHHWRTSNKAKPSTCAACLKPSINYPNVHMLFKLLCTLPATTCTCERSGSTLRNLDNYKRHTMSQGRLSALALMASHYDFHIDLDTVVDLFAKKHPRRLELDSVLSN